MLRDGLSGINGVNVLVAAMETNIDLDIATVNNVTEEVTQKLKNVFAKECPPSGQYGHYVPSRVELVLNQELDLVRITFVEKV